MALKRTRKPKSLNIQDQILNNINKPIRTKPNKDETLKKALLNPNLIIREKCNRSFLFFIQYFWPEISPEKLVLNWHIPYLAKQLQEVAETVGERKPKLKDLIINVPPGSTKTVLCSIMFPAWCWTRWPWMRFITASYSGTLALESAEYSRDLIRSERFSEIYPDIQIKPDKDTKTNFKVIKYSKTPQGKYTATLGGNRYSTSVGGTLTGFHGHMLIVDDPIDPNRAASPVEIEKTNHWISQTLSTRKVDKAVTPTILVMQRLHQNDPSGYLLGKKKEKTFHICLPGEIKTPGYMELVKPKELVKNYKNYLLDPVRLPLSVLKELKADLGQFGYAGQIGQNPVPPGGGMFLVDKLKIIESLPTDVHIETTIRYWDKAGTEGAGDYTAGVKMSRLTDGNFLIHDVVRGQWGTTQRERIIKETALRDGPRVIIYHEQEPGSAGKDSAAATTRNLAGFIVHTERPTGDKVYRADALSVQVNEGNIYILKGDWNNEFIEELRFFPYSTYDDQVDAASGAFNRLAAKRIVRVIR